MVATSDGRRACGDYPKPIIGIVGGIGAGKSLLAHELHNLGCVVIDSDRLAHQAIDEPAIRSELTKRYGPEIISAAGKIDRQKLGALVFRNSEDIKRLNALVHPRVEQLRQEIMASVRNNSEVRAVVLDSPLFLSFCPVVPENFLVGITRLHPSLGFPSHAFAEFPVERPKIL